MNEINKADNNKSLLLLDETILEKKEIKVNISKKENIKEKTEDEKKIEEINNKEYLMEHYVDDPEIIKEYKDLFSPIKKRLKYTFYFNIGVCSLSVLYAKNLGFYIGKYFPNFKKGLLNLVLISSFHAIAFSAILIGGNLAILGIQPRKFMQKYRELDEKIMSTDPYKNLTLKGFIDGVSEGFSKQAELLENQKSKKINEKDDIENDKTKDIKV